MAVNESHSRNHLLKRGVTEGSYRSGAAYLGGDVDPINYQKRLDLDPQWYGNTREKPVEVRRWPDRV